MQETNSPTAVGRSRMVALEALRGIAALIVVAHHCAAGFYPGSLGIFDNFPKEMGIDNSPLYLLVNGPFSVIFFFILSGFVLTGGFFATGDQMILMRGAVKRAPRLFFPVFVGVMLSYLFFVLHFYYYEQAAEITHSTWFAHFANGSEKSMEPNFWGALWQAVAACLVGGVASYNSSLWTMQTEFIGSFVAFGLAAVLGTGRLTVQKFFVFAPVVVIIAIVAPVRYLAFPIGVFLAAYLSNFTRFIPRWLAHVALGLGILLAGYSDSAHGFYSPLKGLRNQQAVWLLAATLVLIWGIIVGSNLPLLNGRFGRILGQLSLPIYVIHVPIMFSLGCFVLVKTDSNLGPQTASVLAIVATVAASIAAAIPLGWLDRLWVRYLSRPHNLRP